MKSPPPCPQQNYNSLLDNHSISVYTDLIEIYYHIGYEKGGNIYIYKNNIIEELGEFTGYSLRPTYKSCGAIGVKKDDMVIWISGKGNYDPSLGWIFYIYNFN